MAGFDIRQVLVPTDTSELSRLALDYGRLFADKFRAKLVILYADPLAYPIDAFTGAPVSLITSQEDSLLLEGEVRTFAGPSLERRDFDVVIVGGQPVPMILRHARECDAGLIVMATHGVAGWRRTILGSVTEGVLHAARCPVLSVRRSDRQPLLARPAITKIVCPINFTDVARDALRASAKLAEVFGCELLIVHVMEGEAGDTAADERRVRGWIAPEIQKNCTYRDLVLTGGAAERILDCAEDVRADLLVIGAQHRLLRDTTVIGTTTERLVRLARLPVLTVVREAATVEKVA